jgi:hypothetical protein
VSTANLRTASYALDSARPIVGRLDAARNPEDVAADIIDVWNAAETALRALAGGNPAGGQALIRDLRAREVLSLEQGHAMLGFLGARDRVARTDYRPTTADVQAVREGFQRLEDAVMAGGVQAPPPMATPRMSGATVPSPSVEAETPAYATGTAARRRAFPLIPIAAAAVLLALLAGFAWWWSGREERALGAGIAAYRSGRTDIARTQFAEVARNAPDLATPHVFLARMARDEGNLPGALSELQTAIRKEPNNALALREMGAYLYTVGRYELARNFYVRSLQVNADDREAQGFLGCSLLRLGRPAEAQRFLQRAGQGPWSACAQQAPPPGMAMQPGVAGPYPAPQPQYPQPQYPQPQYPQPRP